MFFSGIADEAGTPLETQIRAHKELGWRHIEIRRVGETTLSHASDEEFEDICKRLDKAGLRVSCVASQIANWSRDIRGPFEDDVNELQRAIPRMQRLEIPFIRVMSYANKSNVPEAEWRREAIRRLRELADMARAGGVTLVHENCDGWGGLGARQTLELIGEINSPAFKLVFDTGNTVMHGQDGWDYYSKVKQHVVYIHVKDWIAEKGKKDRAVFPGEGQAYVREILSDLHSSGYTGGISIEPHIASVVHEGKDAAPEVLYSTYVEYGRRLMTLMTEIRKS